MSFLPQMEPLLTDADRSAVEEYLRGGGWLTEYEQTRRFERAICDYTGSRYCSITPNGTLALFLALAAKGIGAGDEVIVPAFTMAATATAVILAGGGVVFVDVEPKTLCMDPEQVEAIISSRTRAIIFVSLNGRAPAGLRQRIADWRRRGLVVIEDAAQSLGSYAEDRHLGTLGDAGCFSFSSQKIVTTGQGGAVVTDDAQVFERMRLLRDFGREHGGIDQYKTVGWNLKFTDLQAVIGVSQMERLPSLVERRRDIYASYRERLEQLRSVRMIATELAQVTPWFVDVMVDVEVRDDLIEFLSKRGFGARPFYPSLPGEPAFGAKQSHPVAQQVARSGMWLPSSLHLTEDQIDEVCSAIRDYFSE
jgi:perosamine synthetase